jgi:hypothetical protein
LLATLPGVVSVRIEATPSGEIIAIHVLTSVEVAPKQTVRNIESALLAHLGLRVDHRKVSVATTVDAPRLRPAAVRADAPVESAARREPEPPPAAAPAAAAPAPVASRTPVVPLPVAPFVPTATPAPAGAGSRRYVFEDVEVRRSRTGLHCRVTLTRGDQSFEGEAEGLETEAARLELAARAAVNAIAYAEAKAGGLALAGVRRIDAFDREFAFAGVSVRASRESMVLTGSCEIRDAVEVAGVLAVLDATNRWLATGR